MDAINAAGIRCLLVTMDIHPAQTPSPQGRVLSRTRTPIFASPSFGRHPQWFSSVSVVLKRVLLKEIHDSFFVTSSFLAFLKNGKINNLDINHLNEGHTDIERLRAGGVGGQFWSIYYPCEAADENQAIKAFESIDATKRMIALYPDTFEYVTDIKGFKKAYKKGKIASMLGMEGGQYISNSLAALRSFYDLGVRYMTVSKS